jgi:beta-ureidopropionase
VARIVRSGLIQAKLCEPASSPIAQIKRAMTDKQVSLIALAAEKGAKLICLQELCNAPYFCAEQDAKWYEFAERIPDGPTTRLMSEVARERGLVLVVPLYEEDLPGVYYNTAAVIDADGRYLGKYRKMHIPQGKPGFWEKFYFRPGNLDYPVFDTAAGKIGVSICYDRHFPEGARCLGLAGAEIVFNPSATVTELAEYLWKLEQPAHAVANQYFIGAVNRPGIEAPWRIGEFFGHSYFCDPHGRILATGKRDDDDIVLADLDLDMIRDVRGMWPFLRDRRPDSYGKIVSP